MAKVLPISGGIDASALKNGLARALAMEKGIIPFSKDLKLGNFSFWFRRAVNGTVTCFVGGGSASLIMDAGVIDLITTGSQAAGRYLRGKRQDTSATQAYNTRYAPPPSGPYATWLTDPSDVPVNQMVGTVTFQPFAGHLRPGDEAPSFMPARKAVVPATDPASWADQPDDEVLVAKKFMAGSCPASIFTGRTRLYVQAMYGRTLYRYSSAASVSPLADEVARPTLGSGGMPFLLLPAYARKADLTQYPAIELRTSSGVYFDPTTGKHWLMNVNGATLQVYPLLSSVAGEAARKLLTAPLVDKSTLSQDDKDKLEAFILAYCLPDAQNTFAIALGGDPNGYSMGYGWHWNWSGTVADIVTNTNYDQGRQGAVQYTGMESTQRRIAVIPDADPTKWTASKTVVEGPVRWTVNRLYWCIAEPEWSSGLQLKTTPKTSLLTECNAPFYAFYKRDELQVCRVTVNVLPPIGNSRTFSVNFADPTYGVAPAEFTGGMLDGFCEDRYVTNTYYRATIAVGAASTTDLLLGRSDTWQRWDIYGKTESTPPRRDTSSESLIASGTSYVVSYGYDSPYGTLDTATLVGPGQFGGAFVPTVQFTRETSVTTRDQSSTFTFVVPFNDAEAVFLDTATFDHTSRGQRLVNVRQSQAFVSARTWTPQGGASVFYRNFLTGGSAGGAVSSSTPDPIVTDVNSHASNLLGISAVAATMGDLGTFHDGNDYAGVSYFSLSGVSVQNPVVLSPGNGIASPIGIVGTAPTFPALVGWI